jgi:hypothetical protein
LQWLRRLCLDVLQRTPSAAEQRAFVGAPVDLVVTRLCGQLEAMEIWLEQQLFYFLLIDNFRPQTALVQKLPGLLQDGRLSARDAIGEIVLCPSFSRRNPGNDTFVSVVLEQCLGITVQERQHRKTLEAGKEMYDGRRVRFLGEEGASQADLVKIVLGQRGFTRCLLDRHHRALLGTELAADAPEVDRVHEAPETFFAVIAEWLAGEDYRDALAVPRRRSDTQFVRSLYMDLLDRRPTYEELRNMRNAMQSMADPAPIRAVMAKVILDSGKAVLPSRGEDGDAAFVRQCFVRYLGREPDQEESDRFVSILGHNDAEPQHVVRALVGSPEYQYY